MKKKILALLLTIISTQAFSENLHNNIQNLGYTQDYIFENSPEFSLSEQMRSINKKEPQQKCSLKTADFLKPRVYSRSESTNMIPLLLKLQKKNPTSVKLTKKLAPTCLKAGQTREALYWYTQTYLRDRSDTEALWNMASLAHSLGMKDKAAQYLQEYAKVDPNSAWGRMAKEFLNGEYSTNLKDGFKNNMPRIGTASEGGNDNNSEILVVEGKSTNIETFASEYQPQMPDKPINLLTGKSTYNKKQKNNLKKKTKKDVKKKSKTIHKPKASIKKAGPLGKAAIKNGPRTVTAKPLQ